MSQSKYYGLPKLSIDISSSVGLCSDNTYVGINGNTPNTIEYSKIDGTRSGILDGSNFTLQGGVALIVDGSSAVITQTVLDGVD